MFHLWLACFQGYAYWNNLILCFKRTHSNIWMLSRGSNVESYFISSYLFLYRGREGCQWRNDRSLNKKSLLKSDSHLPNNCFTCFIESPLKVMKNAFQLILKVLFILKIFKTFGRAEKTVWLEKKGYFKNLWRSKLVNKLLKYTYCPISNEVKATRQWNLVS